MNAPRRRARRGVVAVIGLAIVTVVAACGSSGGSGSSSSASGDAKHPSASDYPAGDAAFRTQWASLIKAAQKEGELVVVDGPNVATGEGPVYEAFAKEYGLKLVQDTGSADQVVSRVEAEKQQGIHSVDVAMAGDGATARMVAANVFEPLRPELISPEATDRSTGWPVNYIPYSDPQSMYVTAYAERVPADYVEIWYNSSNVTASDLAALKSWNDFLDPKYKGKMVMGDVSNNETSSYRVLSWLGLGSTYWDKFMRQLTPAVLPVGDATDMANGLAKGEWDFAFFVDADPPFTSAQQEGLPVAPFGTTLSNGTISTPDSNLSILSGAPHPAAAQLFVNWLLSKQGQTTYNALNTNFGFAALRTDTSQGAVPNDLWVRLKGPTTKFVPENAQFATATTDSLAWWKQEFATLGLK